MKESQEKAGPVHAMFDLSGKVALITGGATGLGKAFGEALAEYGADIAIADIDEATAGNTAAQIEKMGRRSLVVKADVTRPDEVQHMVEETAARLGTIDILINNAGVTAKGMRIHEMPLEVFDRVIDIDLRGVFICTRAVASGHAEAGKRQHHQYSLVIRAETIFQCLRTQAQRPLCHCQDRR